MNGVDDQNWQIDQENWKLRVNARILQSLFGHPIFNLDTLDISSDTPDMAYAEAVSPVRLESNEN